MILIEGYQTLRGYCTPRLSDTFPRLLRDLAARGWVQDWGSV